MNKFLCEYVFIFLGYLPWIGIVGSYGMFNILRNCQTFPKELHHFTVPLVMYEGYDFSTSSRTLIFLSF